MWKQAEMAKWRAEMRAREIERMAMLEDQWRRRERQRDTEHKKLVEEASEVEARLKQLLTDTEERERRLTIAEEAVTMKRDSMERDLGNRMTEAQQAVRRLQTDCDHQLEMERNRTREAERMCQLTEERLSVAESRTERVEYAFGQFRAEHRQSPEAMLQSEIVNLTHANKVAEQRAADANRAKEQYKEQVRKLAKQLAMTQVPFGLQRAKMELEALSYMAFCSAKMFRENI